MPFVNIDIVVETTEILEESNTSHKYWEPLRQEAQKIGKPQWRPMLSYLADLHQRATHPAQDPFPYSWEELGPVGVSRPDLRPLGL